MKQALPARSEVPVEDTWDATSIFVSAAAWEDEAARVAAALPGFARLRERLDASAATLADWLDACDESLARADRLRAYAHLLYTTDTTDAEAAARYDRAAALYARVAALAAAGESGILAIKPETLRSWQRDEPRLSRRAHALDRLARRRAHIRSAEVEELLGQLAAPFDGARVLPGIFADADQRFRPARDEGGAAVPFEQGTAYALLNSPGRALRRAVWESYADSHLAARNMLANGLATIARQRVFLACARRYDSALEAALAPGFIGPEVFHATIDAFRRNLPVWHRYWRVRRRALGYDALHPWDIFAPLAAAPPRVPFERGVDWIAAAVAPLGAEYVATLLRGVREWRWVDRYPNRGKRQGAFQTGSPGTHPFILTNYTDDLDSLSGLAHELGHALHAYHAWGNQPYAYAEPADFTAEVASNAHEVLLRAHLLATSDDPDFQVAIIDQAMSRFGRYLFLMPTLARFELELHERAERGKPLTADALGTLTAGLFAEGFGGEIVFDADRLGITWAQYPHHLRLPFYAFQYATGLAGGHALAAGLLDGRPGAADAYHALLRAGSHGYPLDLLRAAGVDLATPGPMQAAFDTLAALIDRLEALTSRRDARAGQTAGGS